MSEGEFVNMTPHLAQKSGPKDVDQSTDTYDTIAWLVANTRATTARSASTASPTPASTRRAGMIDAHPALAAVSPQAPIADWWYDDFHHHGAFFLPHTFNFFAAFGKPRPQPTSEWNRRFDHGTGDGYQFFLDVGPLKNLQERHLHGEIAFWNEMLEHPNRDEFWQKRDLLPHLRKVAPAVMVVGGLFDAEDLYGPLSIYRTVERENPGVFNILVMGPWGHGGWSRTEGDRLGDIAFGAKTPLEYQQRLELPFFEHFLKGVGAPPSGERPPVRHRERTPGRPSPGLAAAGWYEGHVLRGRSALSADVPKARSGFDAFDSDPCRRPVPFTQEIAAGMPKEYMTEDQRFAARRPDVLVYETPPLAEDLTVAGPVEAELRVSTTGTDADWIVKLIDVLHRATGEGKGERDEVKYDKLGGYQMMVRSEVVRGRFRDSADKPAPFVPGKVTRVRVPLLDVLHTFKKGHRLMIQVQSTWFPLVDRNPQTFVPNIFKAEAKDFKRATHKVHRAAAHASRVRLPVLGTAAAK